MYRYWLSEIKSNYVIPSQDNDEFWNRQIGDQTLDKIVEEYALLNVKINLAANRIFDKEGLELSSEVKNTIDSEIDSLIKEYRSKSELNKMLSNYGVNYSILRDVLEFEAKVDVLYAYLYGQDGPRSISSEMLEEFFKENYVHTDLIVIELKKAYETDENGVVYDGDEPVSRELTEEERLAKKKKVEEIEEKLASGTDFEKVKEEYNEDLNASSYPDGYYFSVSADQYGIYGVDVVDFAVSVEEGKIEKFENENNAFFFKGLPVKEGAYNDERYSAMFSDLRQKCSMYDFYGYIKTFFDKITVDEEIISKYSVRDVPVFGDRLRSLHSNRKA